MLLVCHIGLWINLQTELLLQPAGFPPALISLCNKRSTRRARMKSGNRIALAPKDKVRPIGNSYGQEALKKGESGFMTPAGAAE